MPLAELNASHVSHVLTAHPARPPCAQGWSVPLAELNASHVPVGAWRAYLLPAMQASPGPGNGSTTAAPSDANHLRITPDWQPAGTTRRVVYVSFRCASTRRVRWWWGLRGDGRGGRCLLGCPQRSARFGSLLGGGRTWPWHCVDALARRHRMKAPCCPTALAYARRRRVNGAWQVASGLALPHSPGAAPWAALLHA